MTASVPPQRQSSCGQPGSSRHYRSGTWSVIEIIGEVDLAVAATLDETLRAATAPQVVFDLRGVTFLGSTGVSAIVDTWRRCEARGGQVRLLGPTAPVAKVLRITGVDGLASSCASLAELDKARA